jgi:hypothetical protein
MSTEPELDGLRDLLPGLLRDMLPLIDPAALTDADRRALIALVKASVPPDPVS